MNLKTGVARLEDAIITISGPALAISGIIAGVDLATGGNMLKSVSWLALMWAITLLLTLDFQVLALGVRAHHVYASDKKTAQKVIEVALAVLISGAISYVSIQMQSIIGRVNAENITIDQAALQLGINTVWLVWERSSLVLVLIFMSGWLREDDTHTTEASTPPPAHASISDETMQIILQRLEKLDAFEHALQRVSIIEQPQPLLPPGEPDRGEQAKETDPRQDPIGGEQNTGYGDAIEALLKKEPSLTARDVAERPGCAVSTAMKWMKCLEVPAQAEKGEHA
jgi:hypothetical protein